MSNAVSLPSLEMLACSLPFNRLHRLWRGRKLIVDTMNVRKYQGEFHSLRLIKDMRHILSTDGLSSRDDLRMDTQPHGDDNHMKPIICKLIFI